MLLIRDLLGHVWSIFCMLLIRDVLEHVWSICSSFQSLHTLALLLWLYLAVSHPFLLSLCPCRNLLLVFCCLFCRYPRIMQSRMAVMYIALHETSKTQSCARYFCLFSHAPPWCVHAASWCASLKLGWALRLPPNDVLTAFNRRQSLYAHRCFCWVCHCYRSPCFSHACNSHGCFWISIGEPQNYAWDWGAIITRHARVSLSPRAMRNLTDDDVSTGGARSAYQSPTHRPWPTQMRPYLTFVLACGLET